MPVPDVRGCLRVACEGVGPAETVRILAAGAVQGAVLRLEPAIAAASTAKLDAVFDTVGALRDRVLTGDAADVVVLSEAGMAALEKASKAHPGVTLAGRLPAPYGHSTRYLAAKPIGAGARADSVLAILQAAPARSAFADFGFETGK